MPKIPHDPVDLYLAPVVLAVDARITELGSLDAEELARTVAIEGDRPDWDRGMRVTGLLTTIGRMIDCHGWELAWDPRGVRLAHQQHSVVLGVPDTLRHYVEGDPVRTSG